MPWLVEACAAGAARCPCFTRSGLILQGSRRRGRRTSLPSGAPNGGELPGAVARSIRVNILAFHHGRLAEAQARLKE